MLPLLCNCHPAIDGAPISLAMKLLTLSKHVCSLAKHSFEVAMRRVRYTVAMSLDGYIAGPNGESDWIIMDPDIDFGALMNRFDTVLMGRGIFEATSAHDGGGSMPGMKAVVVSRTLRQQDYPNVTIIGDSLEEAISRLRAEPGKDIWLFGGGSLFRWGGGRISVCVYSASLHQSPLARVVSRCARVGCIYWRHCALVSSVAEPVLNSITFVAALVSVLVSIFEIRI